MGGTLHDRTLEGPPLTVSDVTSRTGLSRAEVLEALRAGRVPGAYRVPGGAWSIPPAGVDALLDAWARNDAGPSSEDEGPGRESLAPTDQGRGEQLPEPTAVPQLPALVDLARRVDRALDGLGTRAALVAPAAVWALVEAASAHTLGRDGLCTRCAWQYPCPDYRHAASCVETSAALLLEGER